MSVSMCVCVCVCVHMHACVCACKRTQMCVNQHSLAQSTKKILQDHPLHKKVFDIRHPARQTPPQDWLLLTYTRLADLDVITGHSMDSVQWYTQYTTGSNLTCLQHGQCSMVHTIHIRFKPDLLTSEQPTVCTGCYWPSLFQI